MRKLALLLAALTPFSLAAQQSVAPVVLRVSTALDGRGHVLRDTAVLVEDGKITRIDPKALQSAKAIVYDLRAYTVLPGWIDAHTHPSWHFDAAGKLAGQDEPKERTTVAAVANSW